MIEFKINGEEYKIGEITIQQYYDIYTNLAKQGPTVQLEILSALSKCPIATLKKLEQTHFAALWNELVNGPLNLHDDLPFHKHIAVNGNLYGFTDIKKLSIGELADMDVLRNDPRKEQLLHKMMAVVYRPALDITDDWVITKEYDPDTVEERAKEFLDMPIAYVFGAMSFFLLIKNYSIEAIVDSLKTTEEMTPQEIEMVELSKQVTLRLLETGMQPSSSWQMETSEMLEKLQSLASTMPSTGSLTTKTKPVEKRWNMIGAWLKSKLRKDKNKIKQ
jgi:hypothetical protein